MVRLQYHNPLNFWSQHFRMDLRPFHRGPRGKVFDGTFLTDGYGVIILKQSPGHAKVAGQKRKRGEKRKTRDTRLFPSLDTVDRHELQAYQDVVFTDPNIRDTLFMMHKQSTRDKPRIGRYTSMTRRRHLGTNIMRDRSERFIKHRHNVDEIRAAQDNLSQTNSYSISSADFNNYCSVRGEAKTILGPLYENSIFRKIRWRTSIGKQRDMSFLGNLICRKFGPNPLIVLGDKSSTRNTRFHAPTHGVGL